VAVNLSFSAEPVVWAGVASATIKVLALFDVLDVTPERETALLLLVDALLVALVRSRVTPTVKDRA